MTEWILSLSRKQNLEGEGFVTATPWLPTGKQVEEEKRFRRCSLPVATDETAAANYSLAPTGLIRIPRLQRQKKTPKGC